MIFDPALTQRGANPFIGRDALRRFCNEGTRKKEAGFVTSCVYSPRLKKNIGTAMLPSEKASEKKLLAKS